jgi:hypothetical protein
MTVRSKCYGLDLTKKYKLRNWLDTKSACHVATKSMSHVKELWAVVIAQKTGPYIFAKKV